MDAIGLSSLTTGSDLMFDDAVLACRARTTLARADNALLSTSHPSGLGWPPFPVHVIDDDGEPLVYGNCLQSLAADAEISGKAWHATVWVAPNPAFGVWLALEGRLRCVSSEVVPELMRLSVERVGVGCPYRESPSPRAYQRLPLETYALAQPERAWAATA